MTRIGIWSIQNIYEKAENREEALRYCDGDSHRRADYAMENFNVRADLSDADCAPRGFTSKAVLATGKPDALRKVDVGAQVSGQLKTLSVAIGDKVKKDQLLGVIDPEQAETRSRRWKQR